MNRRSFLAGAVGCALTALRSLEAAASSTVRVAFLRIVPPPKVNVDALEQGFRDLGYAPGRDILIEYRYADGRDDELRRLAADVVARKVDIILAAGYEAIRAAKIATGTIPIVMVVAGDPVGSGFVTSLARPGGNITGNSIINPTLAPKRLEILKQALPTLSRVATLLNKSNPSHQVEWKATLAAAKALAIVVQPYEVRGPMDFEPAFAAMIGARAEAVVVLEDAVFGTEAERLVALAARNHLPAIYGQRNSVDVGGLLSYGPNISDVYRNTARFVDKILRGAKPADLPVEQPARFELMINVKTAKALGLTFPQSLLQRADEVIQ